MFEHISELSLKRLFYERVYGNGEDHYADS